MKVNCIITLDYICNFAVRIDAADGVGVHRVRGSIEDQSCRERQPSIDSPADNHHYIKVQKHRLVMTGPK